MKKRRHTPEQITRKLREADRLLAEGKTIEEVAKHLEISEQSFHRWRNQYGGMKASDARVPQLMGIRGSFRGCEARGQGVSGWPDPVLCGHTDSA